jgi:hypothetical protein
LTNGQTVIDILVMDSIVKKPGDLSVVGSDENMEIDFMEQEEEMAGIYIKKCL